MRIHIFGLLTLCLAASQWAHASASDEGVSLASGSMRLNGALSADERQLLTEPFSESKPLPPGISSSDVMGAANLLEVYDYDVKMTPMTPEAQRAVHDKYRRIAEAIKAASMALRLSSAPVSNENRNDVVDVQSPVNITPRPEDISEELDPYMSPREIVAYKADLEELKSRAAVERIRGDKFDGLIAGYNAEVLDRVVERGPYPGDAAIFADPENFKRWEPWVKEKFCAGEMLSVLADGPDGKNGKKKGKILERLQNELHAVVQDAAIALMVRNCGMLSSPPMHDPAEIDPNQRTPVLPVAPEDDSIKPPPPILVGFILFGAAFCAALGYRVKGWKGSVVGLMIGGLIGGLARLLLR